MSDGSSLLVSPCWGYSVIEQLFADFRKKVNFVDIDEVMFRHIHSSVKFLQEMKLN